MSEYYADEAVTLHLGDCLDILPTLPDSSVDAIVTDPPYAVGYQGKTGSGSFMERAGGAARWDHVGGNHRAIDAIDAVRTRRVEALRFGDWCTQWASECLRILKPGGHLLAFGSPRTHHRLITAVEDAGLEIRDTIDWIYTSGQPKGANLPGGRATMLKPAHEPIVVARATPLATVRETVARHGTGALTIDGCRTDSGGWPPNILLGHYCPPAECLRGCPVREMGDAARLFPVFQLHSKAPKSERLEVDGVRHDTPKPLGLMRWLVRLACPPGGTVLDFCAGSGTTLLAALDEGMSGIGIEKHEPHARIAVARIVGRVPTLLDLPAPAA